METQQKIVREILLSLGKVEQQHLSAINELARTAAALPREAREVDDTADVVLAEILQLETAAVTSRSTIYSVPRVRLPSGYVVSLSHLQRFPSSLFEISNDGLRLANYIRGKEWTEETELRKRLAAFNEARIRMLDAIRTLGVFFSNKAGYGVLAAAPHRIQISFDEGFHRLRRRIARLAVDGFDDAAIARALHDQVRDVWVEYIRSALATTKFKAIGGNFASNLYVTGRLSRSIDEIEAERVGRYVRAGGRKKLPHHVVTIGMRPMPVDSTGRSPNIYGSVLARSRTSNPPGFRIFPGSSQKHPLVSRLLTWAEGRGIDPLFEVERPKEAAYGGSRRRRVAPVGQRRVVLSEQFLKIARSISAGTYGREWMRIVVGGLPRAPVDENSRHARRLYLQHLRELLGT